VSFTLPTFNLVCNLWRAPDTPSDPPTSTPDCQLYYPSRSTLPLEVSDDEIYSPAAWIRFPWGTDVLVGDILEVAQGDGYFYEVRFTDRMHRGFPNQYLFAVAKQTDSSPPPPLGDFILLETGDFVLLESGDKVLVE